MKRFYLFCATWALCVLCAGHANATTVVLPTPEEQVADARAICIGTCKRIESREIDGQITTYITLDVREVLKGAISPGALVLKQAGGQVGSFGQWISGSPRFRVGRESLVFLSTNGEGALVVSGLFLGHFSLEPGPDGRAWIVRDHGGEGALVLPRSDVAPDQLLDRMPLDALRAIVSHELAAQLKSDVADAINQVPPEYTRPFEGPAETAAEFTLMGSNRWFEADTGGTVPFYCNPENFLDGDGNAPDLEAAETDALASWSSVSGSSMRLRYAGVDTSGCGWRRDGVSRVSVDCRNQIGGEGCRSIIAIGGANNIDSSQTVVVNGTTFRRILEADVCLNEGFCDLYLDPVALRYVLAHELGHCIGFGHSTVAEATMYGTFLDSNAERGAALHEDDMAGARFVYPGVEPPPPPPPPPPAIEPPVIVTVNLPVGVVGTLYDGVLGVQHGKAPFVWSVAGGVLPPGLSLSPGGIITGAPAATGEYIFGVRVTDALSRSAERAFTVVIRVPTPVVGAAFYRLGKKRLTIGGANFAAGAQIAINGALVSPPRPATFDPVIGNLELRGGRKKLNLNRGIGSNIVVVTVEGVPSTPFVF